MRGLNRSGRTCSTGRDCQSLEVEGNHESFTFDAIEIDAAGVRYPRRALAIHSGGLDFAQDGLLKPISHVRRSFEIATSNGLAGNFRGLAERDNGRDLLSAHPPGTFLAFPIKHLAQTGSLADLQP